MSEDQEKLLSEAKKQVDRNGFEMKSSLVSNKAHWQCISAVPVLFLVNLDYLELYHRVMVLVV